MVHHQGEPGRSLRVGVVGAGIAGLCAAYELSRAGAEVVVWETRPEPGGQVATFTLGGQRLEGFYHHIFRSDQDFIGLIEDLGLDSDLSWGPSRVGFFYQGKIYPFTTPWDLLRFAPLGLGDRLRLGLLSLRLRWTASGEALEDVTAQEWLKEKAGPRAYRVIWEPLLRGKFGDRAPEIGMAWLWSKMRLRFGSRSPGMGREVLGYLAGSFGRVVDRLVDRIEKQGGRLVTSTPVREIRVKDGAVAGVMAGDSFQPCQAVIATVPLDIFRKLVGGLPPDFGGGVSYLAALVLVLVLRRPLTPVYWLNIADPQVPFVALVEHANFVPPETYGGKRVVYVSNYLPREDPLYSLDKEALLDGYWPALKLIAPDLERGWIEECHLFREDYAQPVITTGYSQRIPPHRTPVRGLYLANTAQVYPEDRGMNYSARMGKAVARMVQEDWQEKGGP